MNRVSLEYNTATGQWDVVNVKPTYRWELDSDRSVYTNPNMLAAIEQALSNTTQYPDANEIWHKITQGETDD